MHQSHDHDGDDEPRCPGCDYALTGLRSTRCPECGAELGDDFEAHRPSRRRTAWSADEPLPLWRGAWAVLRRPIRTLEACADPRRVTVHRAVMFAAIVLGAFLLIWGPLREVIQVVQVYIRDRGSTTVAELVELLRRELPRFRMRWLIPSIWLAWAQVRWLTLFALLALALPGGRGTTQRSRASRRLLGVLLMTPWFLLLDVLCSMTIWAAVGSCVPEPNSMFLLSFTESEHYPELARIWLVRLIVPLPLVSAIFFRGVLGWRWWTALLAGVALIPLAALLWMAWDDLFTAADVYQLIL
jgi:hypothetical protein